MLWSRLFLLLVVFVPVLRAEKLVLARSNVSSGYLEKRVVDGKIQPQTYVFMPGRYMAGNFRDRSLERTSFRVIAERLAKDLKRQDFLPAPSLAKADLLLMVHWGATVGRNRDKVALTQSFEALTNINNQTESFKTALEEANAAGDFLGASLARSNLDALATDSRMEANTMLSEDRGRDTGDTASLLGFTTELHKENGTRVEIEQRKTLYEMTQEECYFVVMMAYDARTLLERKKLKRVWSLRVSINTAGVNFPEALDRIANVAGQYFGARQEGVSFDYPPERKHTESVKMDDIVVLGAVEQ